ncbi:MAG: M28 family peptidase [Candidatus Thorarchaeota archaeon]
MKRTLFIILLMSLFLSSIVSINASSVEIGTIIFEQNLEPLSPARVYGEDLSENIFRDISLESFRNYIIKLTENGSRWITGPEARSDANIGAESWIAEELVRVSDGRIEVEIIGNYHSVVGRLPGYFPYDAPVLLVGGHYDSVIDSPGANDDGTGVAAMLEIARVLSQYEWPLDVYFGAWNAEEIGLIGAREVAQEFQNRGINILVYYNIDMLLVPYPYAATSRKLLLAYPDLVYHEGQLWAEQAMLMSREYGSGMIMPVKSSDFSGWLRSDHWAFLQKGYTNSLFAHESGFEYDSAYHTSQDRWDNPIYDYTVAIEMVKAIGASFAYSMSRAYQQHMREEIKMVLRPGEERVFQFIISTPTMINVSCRWWGGSADFVLRNPTDGFVLGSYNNESNAWEPKVVMSPTVSQYGIYTLSIVNPGTTTTGYEFAFEYDTDVDSNLIPDSQEFWFDTVYFTIDSDSDFLSDAHEYIIGTSVDSADTDQDSIIDSWELDNGLNPLDASDADLDYDSDGILNRDEFLYNCNPRSPDTDEDNIPDLWEIEHGLDPTMDDASEDPDDDAVDNLREYQEGTDPHYAELRLERYFVPTASLGIATLVAVGVYVKWYRI